MKRIIGIMVQRPSGCVINPPDCCPPEPPPALVPVCASSAGGMIGRNYTYDIPDTSAGGYLCFPVTPSTNYHLTFTATDASSRLQILAGGTMCTTVGAVLVNLNPSGNIGCIDFTTGADDERICFLITTLGPATTINFTIDIGNC